MHYALIKMQTIQIKNLTIKANHGVLDFEKKSAQPFVISCDIVLQNFATKDDLSTTINYVDICDCITNIATAKRYNLIETLSDNIAKDILDKFALAKSVTVQVKKPQAPIKHNVDYVATSSKRQWDTVYLGLGSNLGDKEKFIKTGIEALNKTKGILLIKSSSIIKSSPYGNINQPDFLNAAIKIKTYLTPHELLAAAKAIEKAAGRKKARERWGARELDIDILIYENINLISDTLTLPHPDMHNRDFVLIPLKEIEPNLLK